jgi:hypothetical protein
VLHITNGRSVSLAEAGLGAEVLTWDDPLHEGPVPPGLSLHELSAVRAEFIARTYGERDEAVQVSFKERDRTLEDFRDHEEVVLWFEHDLYDQLQLIQLLGYFAEVELGSTRLTLIQSPAYLGPMQPQQLAALFPARKRVTAPQLRLGAHAWSGFCSPDPAPMLSLIETDTSCLPFLAPALRRHLGQFPSVQNGLCRTEQQIAAAIAAGAGTVGDAFIDHQREHPIFMGDAIYISYVRRLAFGSAPVLAMEPAEPAFHSRLVLTAEGRDVLDGNADYISLNGIDRWLGAIHLTGKNVWRWNGATLVQSKHSALPWHPQVG